MQKLAVTRERAIQLLQERYPAHADDYVTQAEERMGITYWLCVESEDELLRDVELFLQATGDSDA